MGLYKNTGPGLQVRFKNDAGGYDWKSIREGETVRLDPDIEKHLNIIKNHEQLVQVNDSHKEKLEEEKQSEPKVVENKEETTVDEVEDWITTLQEIDGVGQKTARDIIEVFPSQNDLESAISKGEGLPFRNDVSQKLIDKYGND